MPAWGARDILLPVLHGAKGEGGAGPKDPSPPPLAKCRRGENRLRLSSVKGLQKGRLHTPAGHPPPRLLGQSCASHQERLSATQVLPFLQD